MQQHMFFRPSATALLMGLHGSDMKLLKNRMTVVWLEFLPTLLTKNQVDLFLLLLLIHSV